MSGMKADLPNGSSGLPTTTVLEIHTCIQGHREAMPFPVLLDENASCCTVTSTLFASFELELVSDPVEDGHSCCHTSGGARAVKLTLHTDTTTYMFAFCVVEGGDMVAVMTGKESCWAKPVRPSCIAAVAGLWSGEEEEFLDRIAEEEEIRMRREYEEERMRYTAEYQAIAAVDRARQEQQQQQQEQQAQKEQQAQQEQAEQAQAGQTAQQTN